jgi:hypothetical protein
MTPAEVAAALVAHPRFVWAAGMRDAPTQRGFEPFHVREVDVDDRFTPPAQVVSRGAGFTLATNLGPPDLADPATAGVLFAMLWEADPAGGWHLHGPPGAIHVHDAREGTPDHPGATAGEAVARALLAVWGPA